MYVVGAQRMPISYDSPTGGAVGRLGIAKSYVGPLWKLSGR